ncbi:hypothetical protein FACS1894211_05620 [Clostridia bacterium]|nr:hypothetical protein FACS1894211_05620 [Clostridia bacterium]
MKQKTTEKTITVDDARAKIAKALIAYYKKHGAAERNKLFQPGIDSLGLSKAQLTDKSGDGTYGKYRALTGNVINELVKAGAIKLPAVYAAAETFPKKKTADTVRVRDTQTQLKERRDLIREYLTARYLTDDEKRDAGPAARGNILKSILNDRNNAGVIAYSPIEYVREWAEEKFVKAARIGEEENPKKDYPNTLIGNRLRNQYEKYRKLLAGELSEFEYRKELKNTVIEAVNILGGAFLEKLSLSLIKAAYGDKVVQGSDLLTGGADDHGIDAEVRVTDELGLEERIVIQAKIKLNSESYIGEKIIREFLGSIALAGAQKGVLITNSTIYGKARDYCKGTRKIDHIALIGGDEMFGLMTRHKIGVYADDRGNDVLDDGIFLIE